MGLLRFAVVFVVLLVASSARAEPERRDESKALQLSAIASAVGIGASVIAVFNAGKAGTRGEIGSVAGVIGGLGSFFGPSFGHIYSGRFFTRGLKLRLLGIGLGVVAVGLAFGENRHDGQAEDKTTEVYTALTLGALVYAIGIVDDIATAPRAAREYNLRHQLTIAPLVDRPSRAAGLAVVGRF